MKIKEFQNFAEKYGFLTSEPVVVESGVSKKTGKAYDSFCYFKLLEYGATDSTTIYVAEDAIKKIQSATESMPYLQAVNVSGICDASGRFTATDISAFSFDNIK